MRIRTLAAAVIGIGCIAAAAGGGYLALRQNQADSRPNDQSVMQAADQPVAPTATDATTVPAAPPAPLTPERAGSAAPASAKTMPGQGARVTTKSPTPLSASPAAQTDLAPTSSLDQVLSRPTPAAADVPPTPIVIPPVPLGATADVASQPLPVEPSTHGYLELSIAAQSVIGIRLDTSVSTETAKVEDRVAARVTRDVVVSSHTVIPAGARLEGSVTTVEHGGKFKNHAHLGVKFDTLYLSDGTRVALQTQEITRDDDSASSAAAAKVGAGAVVGSIFGAILGGGKGAAIGGVAGGGVGAAGVASGKGNEARLGSGSLLTLQLSAPVTITVQKF